MKLTCAKCRKYLAYSRLGMTLITTVIEPGAWSLPSKSAVKIDANQNIWMFCLRKFKDAYRHKMYNYAKADAGQNVRQECDVVLLKLSSNSPLSVRFHVANYPPLRWFNYEHIYMNILIFELPICVYRSIKRFHLVRFRINDRRCQFDKNKNKTHGVESRRNAIISARLKVQRREKKANSRIRIANWRRHNPMLCITHT